MSSREMRCIKFQMIKQRTENNQLKEELKSTKNAW